MNIVYLVFGTDITYHIQTFLSILTVLRYKRDEDTITIYTDTPKYYQRLEERIHITTFGKATLNNWINGTGYIFRAKIKAIEDSVKNNPTKNLLFLDGDTVLLRNGLSEMDAMLTNGNGIMYKDEGHPSKMKGGSLRMWKAINGKCIDGCTVSLKHDVWNSGVIGLPRNNNIETVEMALKWCDMILSEKIKCFTAEQYAFSISMQEQYDMASATKWIAHYWGNKEQWNDVTTRFFLESHMTRRSIEEEIKAIDYMHFESIPMHIKKSNTQRRLTNLIIKLFPDKQTER